MRKIEKMGRELFMNGFWYGVMSLSWSLSWFSSWSSSWSSSLYGGVSMSERDRKRERENEIVKIKKP